VKTISHGTSKITVDLEKFAALKKELARFANARVRVGIMANKADRFDEDWNKTGINNPTIGLIHEFGTKALTIPSGETGPHAAGDITTRRPIPARSWLRMPLLTKLPDEIDKIGRAVWAGLVLKKGVLYSLRNLGALAENVIQRAFATGGFGQWAPLAPFTIRKKGSSAILIDTAYLRKAVSSVVMLNGKGEKA
jgi:hypothetical protein